MGKTYDLLVRARGDTADAQRAMRQLQGNLRRTARSLQRSGQAMTRAITLPVIAVGAYSVKAALDVDKAMATIRTGTGATGAHLEELGDIFRQVYSSVPNDINEVSTTIADLNTRLGLTGRPLHRLSMQMLNLSRITKVQTDTLIPAITRLFGDWSIKTGQQSAKLDQLFKTSQQTGIGVDKLSQLMVDFGSPLRQLGLSFDFTTAMFARFEKEGVNIQTAMPGLRMALKNFAKDGKDPAKALVETFKAIKNTGDAAKANTMAFEIFGARAGPDMAAAIREGRFDLDKLMASIKASPETINKAADASLTFSERLAKFKHQADLALEPVGRLLFPILEGLVARAARMARAFSGLSPAAKRMVVIFAAIAAAVGPLLIVAGTLAGAVAALIPVFAAISAPVVAVVAAVIAVAAALMYAYKTSSAFREAIGRMVAFVVPQVKALAKDVMKTLRALAAFWRKHGNAITRIVVAYCRPLARLVGGLLRAVVGVVRAVLAVIRGDWRAAWSSLKGAVASAIGGVLGFLRGMAGNFASVGAALGKALANALRDAINWVIGKWNDLELPSIKVKGKALTPSIGTPNLPMFARGGVATGPSIFGEAGPEAAVPLGMGSQARMDRRRVLAETGLGGHTFNITIHASSESGGRAAARGFLGALGGDARQRAYSSRVAVAR